MVDPLMLFAVIFGLAFIIETLVEAIFGPVFDKVVKLAPYKWLLMYIAIAVGLVGAFIYQFDLIYLLGRFVHPEEPPIVQQTTFGIILTGLAIGKGSNYLHDLFQKIFVKPGQP
jgi:hypothetical protein